MQPIAAVFAVVALFVVNILIPAFTTVRWNTPVTMGWTSRAPYLEAA
jgi:hypothetical protein